MAMGWRGTALLPIPISLLGFRSRLSSGTLTLNGEGANWTDEIDVTDTAVQTGYMIVGLDNLSNNKPAPGQQRRGTVDDPELATLTDQEGSDIASSPESSGTVTVTSGGL